MWLSGLSGTYNAVLLTTAVYSVNTQTPTRWTMRQIIRTHCHKHSRLAEYTLSPRLTEWLLHSAQCLTSLLSVESEGSLTWWRTPPLMPVLSPIKHTSLNYLRNIHFNIKLYTFTSNNSHSRAGPPESLPISYTLLATRPVNQCSNPGNGVLFSSQVPRQNWLCESSFTGGKAAMSERDHSPPLNVHVKITWSVSAATPPFLHTSSWCGPQPAYTQKHYFLTAILHKAIKMSASNKANKPTTPPSQIHDILMLFWVLPTVPVPSTLQKPIILFPSSGYVTQ